MEKTCETKHSLHSSWIDAFKIAKQTPPSAQKRFQDQFPDVQFDWNEIYSLSLKVSLETKIREFQYTVLNNLVFTNEKLFKIKMIDSPQCTFCKNEIESLEHLLYSCEITRSFWVAPRSWLMECNINWNQAFVLFYRLIWHIQRRRRFCHCKQSYFSGQVLHLLLYAVKPAMRVLKIKIGAIHNIEGRRAFMRNKVEFHDKKWVKIKCCLNWVYPPPPPCFSLCLLLLFAYFFCRGYISIWFFFFQD